MADFSSNFRSRRAFTLVEMLLATSLLALLMVGLLAVITDFTAAAQTLELNVLSQTSPAETESRPDAQALEAFVRLLADDLQHAQSVDATREDQLTITGYASLALDKAPRSHHPVQIVYRGENVGNENLLIRRQSLLNVLSNQNTRRDLVLCGVRRFTLSREPVASPKSSSSSARATQNAAAGTGRWLLRLWSAGQSAPVFERYLDSPPGGVH